MNSWLLLAAGALGLIAGALANFCAEVWSQSAPRVSPWRARSAGDARRVLDYFPVAGWFVRRRAINRIAIGRWRRAVFVELATAALFVYLAWGPTQASYLQPLSLWGAGMAPAGFPVGTYWRSADLPWQLAQFASHALLMLLMLVASLIDFEEKLIPDEVTVPGAYLGLLLAAIFPATLPPGLAWAPAGKPQATMLTALAPLNWPQWLEGAPVATSLASGLACFAIWYLALWPWLFKRGRSISRGLSLTFAWVRKHGNRWLLIAAPLAMCAVIAFTWFQGGERWIALSSSLFGMLFGGAFVWAMRAIASHVMAEEALGFGDVTLMAMIGAFLGWQACLMAFFLAALLALVFAVLRYALLGDRAIYFGPFICAAAAWLVLRWPLWWDWAGPLFGIAWLVPTALIFGLGLLWVLLIAVRFIKERTLAAFGYADE